MTSSYLFPCAIKIDVVHKLYPKFTVDFERKEELPWHIYNEIPNFYLPFVYGSGVIAVNKKKQTSSYIRVINDFFGNIDGPSFSYNKGWFYQMFEPWQLIEHIETRLAKRDCSTQDRKKLEEMLKSLDEDDNNVLFIAKLK